MMSMITTGSAVEARRHTSNDLPLLEIEALEKRYGGRDALRGVDIVLEPGQVVALLGPNGAGKTTLMSIVASVRRADAGRVRLDGVDLTNRHAESRQHIGYAPQELALYPNLTALQNLVFFGELCGLRGRELRRRIELVAGALRFEHLLARPLQRLSTGEKKRIHAAAALLHQPRLLLLDEPTTGADIETRAAILELVTTLAAEGTGILYATHYLFEVEELNARVVFIEEGMVLAEGHVVDLVREHGASAVELTFDGSAPDCGLEGARWQVNGSVLTVFCAEPASVAAEVIASIDDEASRLLQVELIRPGLDSVYLALRGRRFEGGSERSLP